MATEYSWAQANKCRSVVEDGFSFGQPSYAVTAVVFEHGKKTSSFWRQDNVFAQYFLLME